MRRASQIAGPLFPRGNGFSIWTFPGGNGNQRLYHAGPWLHLSAFPGGNRPRVSRSNMSVRDAWAGLEVGARRPDGRAGDVVGGLGRIGQLRWLLMPSHASLAFICELTEPSNT
jgi:hypothetical protein